MKISSQLLAILPVAATVAAQTPAPTPTLEVTTDFIDPTITLSVPIQSGCPTVTETLEMCSTCPAPLCITFSTLTQSCGCPTPAATEYLNFPCKGVCGRLGCSTSYSVVSGEVSCDGDNDDGGGTASETATEGSTGGGSAAPTTVTAETTTTTALETESSSSSTETASGATEPAVSPTATPNAAAGRLAVPFKFW